MCGEGLVPLELQLEGGVLLGVTKRAATLRKPDNAARALVFLFLLPLTCTLNPTPNPKPCRL